MSNRKKLRVITTLPQWRYEVRPLFVYLRPKERELHLQYLKENKEDIWAPEPKKALLMHLNFDDAKDVAKKFLGRFHSPDPTHACVEVQIISRLVMPVSYLNE